MLLNKIYLELLKNSKLVQKFSLKKQNKQKIKFTTDWFTHNIPNFKRCMAEIQGKRKTFLEIGVFEGRSTCWLLKNGLEENGHIFSIDPFYRSKIPGTRDLRKKFNTNVECARHPHQKITVLPTLSYYGLAELIFARSKVPLNFIYIDGAHDARSTLTDACMAFGLLAKGGVMLFDDYEWLHGKTKYEKPKLAIDCFLETFYGKYELLFKNYQVGIKKI